MSTVLIVDDHPLFRDALNLAIAQTALSTAKIQHVATLSEALSFLAAESANLILLDLNLSDASNFEGLTKVRARTPDVPLIIISATETAKAYKTAKTLGANGYIPKSTSLNEIAEVIENVLTGQLRFPDMSDEDNDAAVKLAQLTPAQQKVMSGLSSGLLNKQIAYEMGISEATVKAHMTSIFRKLGANNRTQALLIYRQATQLENDRI